MCVQSDSSQCIVSSLSGSDMRNIRMIYKRIMEGFWDRSETSVGDVPIWNIETLQWHFVLIRTDPNLFLERSVSADEWKPKFVDPLRRTIGERFNPPSKPTARLDISSIVSGCHCSSAHTLIRSSSAVLVILHSKVLEWFYSIRNARNHYQIRWIHPVQDAWGIETINPFKNLTEVT